MNIEETKKAIEVMQAYVDGKEIQFKEEDEEWIDIIDNPLWEWMNTEYRVKPEPKCRPYTFSEMCEAVKKHGILVRSKKDSAVYTIAMISNSNVSFCNLYTSEQFDKFLQNNVWLDDGSPCGIMEDEQ